jgi:outer membrane lipoprotein-sorting protein
MRSFIAFILIPFILSPTISLASNMLTGEEIMSRVEERDEGKDMIAETTMKLINKRGQVRIRKVRMFRKNYGEDTRKIIFFLEPADVRGTAFLSWDFHSEDKEDAQWLYMPALRKVQRILASKKSDYFMGTDFTYDDLGERRVEDDDHKLLRTETVDGYECYVVESTPKRKGYIYSKRIVWVRKDIWMVVRADFYDRKGRFLKRMTIPKVKRIDGIWTATELHMDNKRKNHKTILLIEKVRYNTGIPDDMFTERAMVKGLGSRG